MRLLVKDPNGEYDFWLIQTHHEAPLKNETIILVQGEHKPIWCQQNWRELVQMQLIDPNRFQPAVIYCDPLTWFLTNLIKFECELEVASTTRSSIPSNK